jgi:hypothetical protein
VGSKGAELVIDGLRAQGAVEIRVVVGGTIPPSGVPALEALGVSRVFPMGPPLPEIGIFQQPRGLEIFDGRWVGWRPRSPSPRRHPWRYPCFVCRGRS